MVGRVQRNSESLKDGRIWWRKCEQNQLLGICAHVDAAKAKIEGRSGDWEKERKMKGQEAIKTDKQMNGMRQGEGRRRPKETNPDWAPQQGLGRGNAGGRRGRGATRSACHPRSVN